MFSRHAHRQYRRSMKVTHRLGARTCQECEETTTGGYVIVLRGDVHPLCERCANNLSNTVSRAIRRVRTKEEKKFVYDTLLSS